MYLFLLFPDGRLPSPRWRPVGWLGGAFAVLAMAGLSFFPGSEAPNLPALRNPFGVPPVAVSFGVVIAGLAGLLCCVVLAAWSLVARARRGTSVQRPVEDVLPRMAAIIGQATGAERAEVWMRTGGTEQLAAAWPAQALSAPPPGGPAAAPAPGPLAAPLPVTHAPPGPALTAAPEPDRAHNGRARVFEVEHQGERLGSLRVTSSPREPLTAAGERLVQAVAEQAGLILRNVGLVGDLRASRQRLVAAADQTRRDLERDLHDGAQQQIVALTAKLRLARNQLARDPAVAGQTLAEAQQTLQDLRELARGIHPSVLSDQGILAAVKSRITRFPIGVRLTAGPELAGARYPDEIEGAAYFLVCEALVNVVKHAHASQAQVTLPEDGATLRVEITDDGAGFVPADAAGTGLTGLADRIEAVGGGLSIRSRPGAGTRLAGELPARGRRPAGV